MIIARKVERGLIRTINGTWLAIEREIGQDDSGPNDVIETRRKLLAGPFVGPGAKAQAIQAAGTNRVLA